jgi:hypothetical protein
MWGTSSTNTEGIGTREGVLRYGNFMRAVWKPTLKELGLPDVGIHALRHSAAAALIRPGASPTAVQRILGHRSAAFTLTVYGHIFEADFDAVAENLDHLSSDAERDLQTRGDDLLCERRPPSYGLLRKRR